MPARRITFLESEQLAKLGDYEEFLFRFAVVDQEKVGTPEEPSLRIEVPVIVRISRTLQNTWRLQLADLPKVLFEFAKSHLTKEVSRGVSLDDLRVDLNTSTAPETCQYDPTRIVMERGDSFDVDASRDIGFRTG